MNSAVAESFYKEYFEHLPKGYDDVYIIHANSGEAYCFLAYLAEALIKKNNAKNPLFVATKPYHEDMISMYFPDARSVFYNLYLKEPRLNVLGDFWEYKEHKFVQIFSPRHFNRVNSNLGAINYFDAMLETLGLNRTEASKPNPVIDQDITDKVIKTAERIDLDLDNFVIIAPEALTTGQLPPSVWHNLIKELYQNDYDVFLNTVNINDLKGKHYNFSYAEAFALATMAKGVIALKSGFSEFLIPAKSKNIALCKKFHWSPNLTTEQCMKAYSVLNLPYIDKNMVFEINTDLYETEAKLIGNIMELL